MHNHFSAADLVKHSAAKIKYIRDKRIYNTPTPQQRDGVAYQATSASKGSCQELKGMYKFDEGTIHYTNDEVGSNFIIEHKMVKDHDDAPDWYMESSIVQCALYKSFIMKGDGKLITPKFRLKQGYDYQELVVDINIDYILNFGGYKFQIYVDRPEHIINYFVNKAQVTLQDWDSVKEYDKSHKYKEFDNLQKLITMKEL